MNSLKVCFVGSGSIGTRHIKNLSKICRDRNIQLQADILRSTDHSLDAEIRNIISNIYRKTEELDLFYDLIFITNPTYLHYQTIASLKTYSRCFFVEKPVFSNLEKSLTELDLPSNNIYYVACPLRYTSILKAAKDFLKEHRPVSVRAVSSSYLPDWRPGTDYRKTYSAHSLQGGGVRIDLIHEWDYLIWLFGKPSSVRSFFGKYSDLEIDSEDLAVYIAQYNDFLMEIHLNYFGRIPERKLEVYTKNDFFVFDIIRNKIIKNGKEIFEYQEAPNEKYMKELASFLDIYEKRVKSPNDLENAVQTLMTAICDTKR